MTQTYECSRQEGFGISYGVQADSYADAVRLVQRDPASGSEGYDRSRQRFEETALWHVRLAGECHYRSFHVRCEVLVVERGLPKHPSGTYCARGPDGDLRAIIVGRHDLTCISMLAEAIGHRGDRIEWVPEERWDEVHREITAALKEAGR